MLYRVTLEADFVSNEKNPEAIRRKIDRLVKEQGWQDKGFEIGIERIKKRKEINDKARQNKTDKKVV